MLQTLLNDFRAQPSGGLWALVHMQLHRDIANILQTKYSISVPLHPLDPMPLDKDMSQWLEAHQRMHDSISYRTGIADANLSQIDLENDSSVKSWLAQHLSEHTAMSKLLGINT